MNYLIRTIQNGQFKDSYRPKTNPVACFIGQVEEKLTSPVLPPYFKLMAPTYEFYVGNRQALIKALNCAIGEPVTRIRAYSFSPDFNESTYVELKIID